MGLSTSKAFLRWLGSRISQLRRERRMTQRVLAERAAITSNFLSEVERGESNVSVLVLRSIAYELNVTLAQLMAGPAEVDADISALLHNQPVATRHKALQVLRAMVE